MSDKYNKKYTLRGNSDKTAALLAKIDFNTEIKDASGNDSIEKITGNIILAPNNMGHDGYFEKSTISLSKEKFLFSTDRNMSLSFWIKSGTSRDGVIISNKDWRNGSNIGWLLGINNDYLVCNWKGDSRSRFDLGSDQNIKIADNNWHHIVVTFDRQGDAVFYKDGEEVYTINIANSGNIDSGYATVIGADALGKYPLDGCHLDEFEIHDKLLSQEDIKQRYYDLKDKLQKPLTLLMNFEDDLKDSTGQIHHGVATGDISFVRSFDGKAVKLTKSYITLPQSELFSLLDGDFSISFWIKSNAQYEGVIFSNKDWSIGGNIGWVVSISGEKLRWNWKGNYGGRLDVSDILVADFKWHHVAITHNRRGDAIFYIDGQEKKRISIADSGHTNTHLDFNIGADGWGNYRLENGLLDRVQISNIIITPQQVQQEYEAYDQLLVPALKTLHYSFDGTLSESADTSYHAIAHGEEAYVPNFANSAFLFDGQTFLTIPNAELQNELANDFSLCFWIKSPTLSQEQTIIANKDWSSGGNPGWQVGIHENTLSWNWKGSNAGRYDLAAQPPIHMADGRWHQITVSHDRAGNACFYKDGVLQQRVDIRSSGDTTTTLDIAIGADAKGQYRLSEKTQIDELRIINRAVNAQEALAFYEEYRDRVVKPLTEKFSGSLTLIGAEQTVPDSAFSLNLHLRTNNMVNVIDEFVSELHYDPSSFEFIEAIGRDISAQITAEGVLKITGYGGQTFNNSDPLDWQKTKMGELRFQTTATSGAGEFSLLNSQFYENGRLYQIGSLDTATHNVIIHQAPSLDPNQDGVITLADIIDVPLEQQLQAAQKLSFMPYKRVLFIGMDGAGTSVNPQAPYWSSVNAKKETVGDRLQIPCLRQMIEFLVQIKEFESRVSAYALEALQNGQWLPVYQGTTVGPNAKLYFPRVKASQIRLNITAASDLPSIYELQIFDTEKPPAREISDSALIELEARKSFDFFWEMANNDPASPGYGLVSDSKQSRVCNVAQVGFALSAIPIGIDNGWITREEGTARTLGTLNMLLNNAEQHKGFFYHFLDKLTGKRIWTSELSTIDTTLALNGVIVAGEYFGGEIKQMADQIYHKVEWDWFRDPDSNQFYMAWFPENGGGFGNPRWSGPVEQASMYVLAAGSPTHPVSGDMFYSIGRDKRSYRGSKPVFDTWFGSSFTNQFSNAWVDFRGKIDKAGDDWFNDAVLNSQISRQYSIDEQDSFKTFGPDSWGLSAGQGPDGRYHGNFGAPPATAANTDGTMVLSGAVGAIVFTPKESLAAMQNYYRNHPYTWGKYGFNSGYNLDVTPYWYASSVNGLEKGISIVMLENYRTGIIWRLYMQNDAIKRGIAAIGLMEKE